MSKTRTSKRLPKLKPRVKVWLEVDGDYVFGHGLAEILQAVESTGSLKEAAAKLGKSYRHVWSRVKEAEAAIGQTLVETQVGGTGSQRSSLSPRAQSLLTDFAALRTRMMKVLQAEFSDRFTG